MDKIAWQRPDGNSGQEMTMKTTFLLALALTLVSADAYAISRYNVRVMSCERARSLVSSEGAVILRYSSARNPGLPLYDRYVADGRFCSPDEYAKAAWVPTNDTASCPVWTCEHKSHQRHFSRRH